MTTSTGSPPPMRTALRHVRGLGSARSGTHHFWAMRLSSLALVPLTIAFVVIVVALLGRNHAAAVQILGSPLVAIVMLMFVAVSIYHMWLGMQEIIVDYVHGDLLKLMTLMGNAFFSLALGVACAFAVLKLSFGV